MQITYINSNLTKDYINNYSIGDSFIETGTFMGDTVRLALEHTFTQIHSVEYDRELYEQAQKKFADKQNVKIWHGNSPEALKEILINYVKGPATFWLDAHASGSLSGGDSSGTPLLEELEMIRDYGDHQSTIFIDDVRLFGSEEWGGIIKEQAISLLEEINPKYQIEYLNGFVDNDILVAYDFLES